MILIESTQDKIVLSRFPKSDDIPIIIKMYLQNNKINLNFIVSCFDFKFLKDLSTEDIEELNNEYSDFYISLNNDLLNIQKKDLDTEITFAELNSVFMDCFLTSINILSPFNY